MDLNTQYKDQASRKLKKTSGTNIPDPHGIFLNKKRAPIRVPLVRIKKNTKKIQYPASVPGGYLVAGMFKNRYPHGTLGGY